MEHKNVTYAKLYVDLAESDLKSANKELEIGNYHTAVYFAQQVAEKAMKAVLFLKGRRLFEHKIASEFAMDVVGVEIGEWEEKLRDVLHKAIELEKYWLKSRYPMELGGKIINPKELFKREDAETYVKYAKEVLETIKEYLEKKFGLSF